MAANACVDEPSCRNPMTAFIKAHILIPEEPRKYTVFANFYLSKRSTRVEKQGAINKTDCIFN
jgi:hypothetical protein